MAGSWHVGVRLLDGRHAYANHDDPIVPVIRRINRLTGLGKPRRPEDDAQVSGWLDDHGAQVRECLAGTCGHTIGGDDGEIPRLASRQAR